MRGSMINPQIGDIWDQISKISFGLRMGNGFELGYSEGHWSNYAATRVKGFAIVSHDATELY